MSTKKVYPSWFEDWFVGFAEGDGSFICDLEAKRLFFIIRQKDPKVLYLIKAWLGFGSVYSNADGYNSYVVSHKQQIETLIHIFNGKLFFGKTNDRFVSEWLTNYNSWHNANITYKGKAPFAGFDSAWLCGLTDADGSLGFKVVTDNTRKHGCRVRIYWYIDQAGHNITQDLNTIKTTLNMGYIEDKILCESSFVPTLPAFRLTVMSTKDCKLLHNYFTKYPPQTTTKIVRFIRWSRVLNWCLDRTWSMHLDVIRRLIQRNKTLDVDKDRVH